MKFVVLHPKEHFDDRIGWILAKKYGPSHYGEKIDLRDLDQVHEKSAMSADELEEQFGIIPIGWKKGWADDHNPEERKFTCAAKKVAEKFGITDLPNVKNLVDYTLHVDTTDAVTPLSIPTLIKTMNSLNDFFKRQRILSALDQIFELYLEKGYKPSGKQAEYFDRALCFLIAKKLSKDVYAEIRDVRLVRSNNEVVLDFKDKILIVKLPENKCAAFEVARKLRIHRAPYLSEILRYAKGYYDQDVPEKLDYGHLIKILTFSEVRDKAIYSDFEIGGLMDMLNQHNQLRLGKVLLELLDNYVENKKLFFTVTPREYKKSQISAIKGPAGSFLKLCVAVSPDPRLQQYARLKGCDIVIQENPELGSIGIFSNSPLYELSGMLRYLEQERSGKIEITDPKILRSIGVIDEIPQWYLMHNGRILLNGSISHKPHESRISLKEVVTLLQIAMDEQFFTKKDCLSGVCRPNNKCSLQKFKLLRCVNADSEQTI